ncbi:MAG: cbb3-type cytochrome c oxidase subunit I, partial [Candidatus Rokubacteria bacterium]|nr:cbb3-type cytochrome c oxidase subunit I [Candidatus Rokubacteria bacterium]
MASQGSGQRSRAARQPRRDRRGPRAHPGRRPGARVAIVATSVLSFGLWVHHMFTTGLAPVAMGLFSAASLMIAVPSGVQVFGWIATLWTGRPTWRTPLLFAVGFLAIFTLGGLTGVMLAVVPFNWPAHDTHFVVGHFH